MSSGDSRSWPTGINGYDILREKSTRNPGKGEREAIAPYIVEDEPVVGMHAAFEVSNESDGTLLQDGVVILSTDRKLLLVSARGSFRPKFTVKTFDYAGLLPSVPSRDVVSPFGNAAWYSGFKTQRDELYLVRFFDEEARDDFVRDVGGALGGWHIIHGSN